MNEHQKTAQTSGGFLRDGGVALFMVAIMCIVALTTVVSVDVHAEDASNTSDVYGGIATDYDGLTDGATYKVASGGTVYIWYGENDISEIGSQLDGTGLAINAESKSIEGEIEKTCYIKIADKTVCLECVGVIYGSNPVYGDTVLEALPVAYVGQKYEQKFEVTSGSGVLGVGVLDDYNVHTSDFDPAEYGLSVSFSSERSGTKWYIYATISGTPTKAIDSATLEIWSNSHSAYHQTFTAALTIKDPYTVTFDAGNGSCAVESSPCYPGNQITLPSASLSGYTFAGWYDGESDTANLIGKSGQTYTPNGSITLYAHYDKITYGVEVSPASYQIPSGGYVNHKVSYTLSDGGEATGATFKLLTDPLGGILSFDEKTGTLSGYLRNVLPSTGSGYLFQIEVSKDGYETAVQDVVINVPVFVYEPLDETLETGEEYRYRLEANPSDSYIDEVTVYEGEEDVTADVELEISSDGKTLSITFAEKGVYEVVVLISADGCASTTKTLNFNVTDPQQFDEDPSIDGIIVAQHPTEEGMYYFTAQNAENYNRIVWTISDGFSATAQETIVHKFSTQGVFTVTCTVSNTTTGKSDMATFTMNPTVTVDRSSAYVNKEYSILLSDVPSQSMTLETSPNQSWLHIECFESDGVNYARVYGTCTNGSLVDTEVIVSVKNGSAVYDSWTVTICADPDNTDAEFTTNVNGYVVTITNTGTSGLGSVMAIDWNGDGSVDETVRGQATVTHDYSLDFGAGTYSIIIEYTYYDVQRTIPLNSITVPMNSTEVTEFTVYFEANGGTGSVMQGLKGERISAPACTYVRDGYEFVSWNTQPDGSGTEYKVGSIIEPTANMNLYAIWKAVSVSDDGEPDQDSLLLYAVILVLIVLVAILIVRQVM